MTLRHFQIFAAVCDTMNMTAAAHALYMSQSAVSQAVSELESHYDIRLFERLSRKLYLTQAGEKLIGYARHIIRLNADAEGDMRNLSRSGRVRVGASVTVGSCVLPGMIAGLKRLGLPLDVEVTEDNTTRIEQLILQDQLDIGLVEGDITSPDIVCAPFAEDTLVLVCGKGHSFFGRSSVEPHELEQENFILREVGSGTRKIFEEVMETHGLRWTSTWVCNNADTIKAAVAEGLGVSVISLRAVQREIQAGLLRSVPINGLAFERRFKLVYHKNKYLTQAMKTFINFCQEDAG